MADVLNSDVGKQKVAELRRISGGVLLEEPVHRIDTCPEDTSLLAGCYTSFKNVCRSHGDRKPAGTFEGILSLLNHWIDGQPKDDLNLLTVPCLHFHATAPTPTDGAAPKELHVIAALSGHYWNPKVQRYVMCCVAGSDRPDGLRGTLQAMKTSHFPR